MMIRKESNMSKVAHQPLFHLYLDCNMNMYLRIMTYKVYAPRKAGKNVLNCLEKNNAKQYNK